MKLFVRLSVLSLLFIISSCAQKSKETVEEKFQFAKPAEVGMIADSLAKIEPW